jgi:hypothetical protein
MGKKQLCPYQNLSLKDLPGETWRDIPGFEGEYEVSSHGRIKSLRRWRNSAAGGYYTKEKIRKQGKRTSYNHLLGKSTYTIGIVLKKDGHGITRSTARYVYHAFVQPFEIEDQSITISYKDCDGQNLHYKNLFLTDRSGLNKRSFRLKRSEPKFWKDSLPVRQLTIDGKLVASYASLKEAQDNTGILFTAIAACVDGRTYQSHGFKWESPVKAKTDQPLHREQDQIFNEYLWQELGKPRTSKKRPIAALNLSIEDMGGERWKPIEGTEGHYQVSNYGRVKRCPGFKNGRLHIWTKASMKRLIPDGKPDRPVSCLLTTLSSAGRQYQQSVARLVYHHFVRKIDLHDKTIRVGYKNGKCYDLYSKNLTLQ